MTTKYRRSTVAGRPDDPCPFCGAEVAGGRLFRHLRASPDCERGFDAWRRHRR